LERLNVQFTDGIGIQATSTEIAALLAFCKDAKESKVYLRLEHGKLLSWATCGFAAVYHHGEAWDGKGKASQQEHVWQISADALSMIRKGMGKSDEVILQTNKKLSITGADIRDIETGEKKPPIGLDGFVSEQLELNMPKLIPERPGRRTGEIPVSQLTLAQAVIGLLAKVCKAADTEANRFFFPSDPHQPVYVEVDKPSRLYDEEQPRWIVVLAPMRLAEAAEDDEGNFEDQPDPAGGDEA
jgi:hypothetical protein